MARDSLQLSRGARARAGGRTFTEGSTVIGLRRGAGVGGTEKGGKASGKALVDLAALIPDSPRSLAQVKPGGFKKLYRGMMVQGSDAVGGTQPDFLIETGSPRMRDLAAFARQIGAKDWPVWRKIDQIQSRVRESIRYPMSAQEKKAFDALNRQFHNKAIPIGKYHELGLADCRGFAITTQVMLQEARIDAFYAYGKTAYQGVPGFDHGFNVLRRAGRLEVVDTLNPMFNKVPVKQMLTEGSQGYVFELHSVLPFVFGSAS